MAIPKHWSQILVRHYSNDRILKATSLRLPTVQNHLRNWDAYRQALSYAFGGFSRCLDRMEPLNRAATPNLNDTTFDSAMRTIGTVVRFSNQLLMWLEEAGNPRCREDRRIGEVSRISGRSWRNASKISPTLTRKRPMVPFCLWKGTNWASTSVSKAPAPRS